MAFIRFHRLFYALNVDSCPFTTETPVWCVAGNGVRWFTQIFLHELSNITSAHARLCSMGRTNYHRLAPG